MAVIEKVRGLIERLAGEPVCDECVAEKLDLSWTSQANLATRELAGMHEFERRSTCARYAGPNAR